MKQWEFEISETSFCIDGKQVPFLCGEIHYFRMPRESWEKALDCLVEAGCNAVAYYVPWFVHEYQEGEFDFEGKTHPQNDLRAWIRLTMEKGLLAYVRPGPYVYAETTDLGIPRWFTTKYRDAVIKHRRTGTYQETDFANAVEHNHPDFLKAVSHWYEKVCKEIRDYQAPKGNIVMFQLCNEIPGDDYDDENPVNLELGDENGIWPSYLREAYGTIEELNGIYPGGFTAFSQIAPHELRVKNPECYQKDRLSYYFGTYYPEYFRRLKGIAEENGITVPLTHNAYNPRAVSLHYQNKQKNPWLLIGLDCYYSLSGRLGIKDATYFCEFGAEYAKNFLHNVPFVIEQESGYWNDVPAVYGPELYIFNIWTFACGYQGMNMYMFAGGENRPGMGFYGSYHGWQAPVDVNGEKTDTYEDIKRSLADIKSNQDVLLKPMVYDISLGIINRPGLIWEPLSKMSSDAYFLLKSAGFTPSICDYAAMQPEAYREHKAIYVVSDFIMEKEVQEKLAAYVKGGGCLILQGRVPVESKAGESCTVLMDELGLEADQEAFGEAVQQKQIINGREYLIGNTVQGIKAKNAAELSTDGTGKPCALRLKAGMGQALILPYAMELMFFEQARALGILLESVKVKPMIDGAKMLRVIPKADGELIIMNLHPVTVHEHIRYERDGEVIEFDAKLLPHSFQIRANDNNEKNDR